MATLTEMQKELEALTARVRAESISQIMEIMAGSGLTLADLTSSVPLADLTRPRERVQPKPKLTKPAATKTAKPKTNGATPPKNKGTRPAKYIDPDTGATWSGMGHTPGWLKDVKNRDKYLIQ
jgi:DNA-binding protein H-NS